VISGFSAPRSREIREAIRGGWAASEQHEQSFPADAAIGKASGNLEIDTSETAAPSAGK